MSNNLPSVPPTFVPAGWHINPATGQQQWWDGSAWAAPQQPVVNVRNSAATAALVLGIVGFVLMGIPLFIGWVFGGIPDILAVIFGIIGISRSGQLGGVGKGPAITGLVLASVSLLSVFIGAGSIW